MTPRTLTLIRNDLRNYLSMAATFRAIGEHKYAAEYRRHAAAMEQELEALRAPERIQS